MAYGTLLSELLLMLKAEVGVSLTAGVATSEDARYRRLLSNKQKALVHEYDFPNLQVQVDAAVTQRYNTWPTTVSRDRPVKLEVLWNSYYTPLDYGITAQNYLVYNSDNGIVANPLRRWRFINDGVVVPASLTLDRYELWPVPASAQTLRFHGQMVLPALVVDTDKAVLDDLMLVLFVAADILKRSSEEDAEDKLAQATLIARRLMATLPEELPVFKLGQEGAPRGTATEPRLTKIKAAG